VLERIVDAIAPRSDDTLVEIGPGKGALTEQLLRRSGRLAAIELDSDLIPGLLERCRPLGELRLVEDDALRVDFQRFACAGPIRLVGNLPYNVSTPLIFHVLEQLGCIVDMHFMLQREVVQRICAGPGGRDYGRLSVMVQYLCRADMLFEVSPEAFWPQPKVVSALVRLVPHSTPPHRAHSADSLRSVVAAAFGKRRKTLGNALKGVLSAEQIEAAGVDPSVRAQTLDVAAFVRLSNVLARPA
jgi:16S rRNA (adenine1518-N6/adenine1519-N6)-dimethyltransferase